MRLDPRVVDNSPLGVNYEVRFIRPVYRTVCVCVSWYDKWL